MGTVPPCGPVVTFPSKPRLAVEWLLEGCTPGTWDSEFAGKGLSETIAWVAPRSLPGSRPRCLSLEPFSGSHHAAEACEG